MVVVVVVCVYVCMHACMLGGMQMHVCTCTWRPEVNSRHLPLLLFTLFLETQSLPKPEAHQFASTSWPGGDPLLSTSPVLGILDTHHHSQLLTWVLGIRTQTLKLI